MPGDPRHALNIQHVPIAHLPALSPSIHSSPVYTYLFGELPISASRTPIKSFKCEVHDYSRHQIYLFCNPVDI